MEKRPPRAYINLSPGVLGLILLINLGPCLRIKFYLSIYRPLSDESGTPGADGKPLISSAQTNEDNAQIFVMNNYFGLGLDADLCLDFHNARQELNVSHSSSILVHTL